MDEKEEVIYLRNDGNILEMNEFDLSLEEQCIDEQIIRCNINDDNEEVV